MYATYSPEDNKLRLYPDTRLDADDYAKVKAAGFRWAPRQELFVAPMWTPGRVNFLEEFTGEEVGDEDTSLCDRAEERAERFEGYSEHRLDDAHRAHEAVSAIADGIPMGQPILVGHHSERHARRDAAKIQNGMRRAVKMWETSNYWTRRAKGAIRHAKYLELPAVRARRIKKIEAGKRKAEKYTKEAQKFTEFWSAPGLTMERALKIANIDHIHLDGEYWCVWSALDKGAWTPEKAAQVSIDVHTRTIKGQARWIEHYTNRLAYERAMLGVSGGLAADKYDIKPGGRVLVGDEWCVVFRVNKAGGRINSLTTNRRYVNKVGIERVKDYREPTPEDLEKIKKVTKLPPITNFPGGGTREITKAQWAKQHKDYKGTRVADATETHGRYRYRCMMGSGCTYGPVFITDQKRVDPPEPVAPEADTPLDTQVDADAVEARPRYVAPEPTKFDAMRDTLRAGVQVVSAPQLFPTPPELARRMVMKIGGMYGKQVLEPSAGTGNIVKAIVQASMNVTVKAVELNGNLADGLRSRYSIPVICGDFLEQNGDLGKFDAILMNPPFANGADIKHIEHARTMLKPGGRLVAICANGPRQQERLKPIAEHWEDLPAGTFQQAGTNVNTALLVLRSS